MTTAVGPAMQQGLISTQIEIAQTDKPAAAEAPRPQEAAPPPPPPPPPEESGRGKNVDTSA